MTASVKYFTSWLKQADDSQLNAAIKIAYKIFGYDREDAKAAFNGAHRHKINFLKVAAEEDEDSFQMLCDKLGEVDIDFVFDRAAPRRSRKPTERKATRATRQSGRKAATKRSRRATTKKAPTKRKTRAPRQRVAERKTRAPAKRGRATAKRASRKRSSRGKASVSRRPRR